MNLAHPQICAQAGIRSRRGCRSRIGDSVQAANIDVKLQQLVVNSGPTSGAHPESNIGRLIAQDSCPGMVRY